VALRATPLDQDAAHGDRRDGGEVRAVFPRPSLFGGQPQVGFMHERGGLYGLWRSLVPQIPARHPA